MKIMVLNLSRKTTEAELAELFERFGKIVSCNLVLDKVTGTSKGFGFVEMPDHKAAMTAISELHNTKFSGNKIRVKTADDRKAS